MGVFSDQTRARLLSPSRRIGRQAPVKGQRACALLFDESPCAAADVTGTILNALREASACATFAVYGSTAENYPDRPGKRTRESGRGIHYAHLPNFGDDASGGAANCPQLIDAILRSGCTLAASGYRFLPNASRLFSRRKSFQTISDANADLCRLLELLPEPVSTMLPPFGAEWMADGRSAFDLCNAHGLNCISPAVSYASNFYAESDGKAEAERMVRSMQHRLNNNPACFDGKIIRLDGGLAPTLNTPAVPLAIRRILTLLREHGYALLTVEELMERSPFSDLDESVACRPAACSMLKRGYTVACLGGKFRPNASVQRDMLYAMLVPPHIMRDYMQSRLTGAEPQFAANRRTEKEFWLAPGSPISAGMFYAYEAGWPLGKRQAVLTTKTFAAFLEQASAGKTVTWTPPTDRALLKSDIIMALDQLIQTEQVDENEPT